ncbi:7,8-didemethyl-8-hydroxy-5-deazariboflavin synthase subunit CofG [Altericista sp. CCNU0014]|uniref:7,8-didemethyl-8-hydroxy-5-deazariboflavin synthase subunit CofG n=1 Tax=Altericista sp. CCNU0014 TaxID=3082949 RepID=UPI00384ABFB7
MAVPQVITYSPAFTLVPTYECFNRCTYCNFRTDSGQSPWLTLEAAAAQLSALRQSGIVEILVLSGEVHPRSTRRRDWFERIYQICELALSMGFLPHTNAGPLSYDEMARLRQVNVSMGLMLEQTTPRLQETVHRNAPSKDPALRLQQLEWAGELKIPFTTGLLLGLGETQAERRSSLKAIAAAHLRWGHIQEAILQPYSPGQQEQWAGPGFELDQMAALVAIARELLPDDITLQIPPNLVRSPQHLRDCLEAGARDLGGLVPRDHVNPDYAHATLDRLAEHLDPKTWRLQPRLPVYPAFDEWLPASVQDRVKCWRARLEAGYTGPITAIMQTT